MSGLKDKVALITGAGQGVGQGIALAMASEGAKVALFGRTVSKLEATAAIIAERGAEAMIVSGDVKSADDLNAAVAKVIDQWDGIDILVNNAQEVPLGPIAKVTDEAFTAGLESGPLAVFRLMKLVQPTMKERGGGVIFNMISSAGIRWDMAGYGPYGSIKQAMRPLTRGAASEWGSDNIRVMNIAPHADSPSLKYWIENNPDEAKEFFKTIPLGRIGRCEEDIGRAVAALCKPEMGYLTGATIPLDGGQANFD
ncbi:MAG: SDR family oxidoreductase [Parasphingorhabdus sp.]